MRPRRGFLDPLDSTWFCRRFSRSRFSLAHHSLLSRQIRPDDLASASSVDTPILSGSATDLSSNVFYRTIPIDASVTNANAFSARLCTSNCLLLNCTDSQSSISPFRLVERPRGNYKQRFGADRGHGVGGFYGPCVVSLRTSERRQSRTQPIPIEFLALAIDKILERRDRDDAPRRSIRT